MNLSLLDTDMLSELLKQQNANVVKNASEYYRQHGQFALSIFTRFETLRGLKEKNAVVQIARFELFCRNSFVIPLTDDIVDCAADLWVQARQGGHPNGDADLIIASTALIQQRSLVTGNTNHFNWIPNLSLGGLASAVVLLRNLPILPLV